MQERNVNIVSLQHKRSLLKDRRTENCASPSQRSWMFCSVYRWPAATQARRIWPVSLLIISLNKIIYRTELTWEVMPTPKSLDSRATTWYIYRAFCSDDDQERRYPSSWWRCSLCSLVASPSSFKALSRTGAFVHCSSSPRWLHTRPRLDRKTAQFIKLASLSCPDSWPNVASRLSTLSPPLWSWVRVNRWPETDFFRSMRMKRVCCQILDACNGR